MWEAKSESLHCSAKKITVTWNGETVGVGSAFELCSASDGAFRASLIRELRNASFAAYFWEMPPITRSSLERPFEFVLTEARALVGAAPDVTAFAEYFTRDDDGDGVVTFQNLGGDATLLAPCPFALPEAYVHLAAFVRGAPEAQVHALFRCLACEALSRVASEPMWISTAGAGVYWLHVRLDSRPKYYQYGPYRTY